MFDNSSHFTLQSLMKFRFIYNTSTSDIMELELSEYNKKPKNLNIPDWPSNPTASLNFCHQNQREWITTLRTY